MNNSMGKPKAAILTWCGNNGPTNYGQILQCYAMQYLVKKEGYEPVVVQYRKKGSRDLLLHDFSNRTSWGRLLNERYEKYYNLKIAGGKETLRVKRFRKFIKMYIPLSPPCYTKSMVEQITRDCRVLICGSDQIWNPAIFDPIWFLDFGTPEQKRIAFAPSGIFYEKPEFEEIYRRMALLIDKLDEVSVREKTGADILNKYVKRKVEAKEDPTLCLDKSQWDQIAEERLLKEDYIFCYLLGSISPYQMILRELLSKYQASRVVYIPSNMFWEGGYKEFLRYEDAGPAQFLSLVKYAKAVCTDSFHGTVMAIQYGVPFYNVNRAYSDENWGSNVRTENLLAQRGLEKRCIRSVRDVRECSSSGGI